MKISNVGKLSLIHIPSKVMKELIIRKNPMNVSNVDKTFSLLTHFQRHENLPLYPEMYTGEKPYECKQCEKAYSLPRSFLFSFFQC
ncbi:hypothetical protein QTO34_015481 [Cnephaeus nilssonii]|uniref:Uncharacterized protein n=1 Tax=Cnephaeus nilssonii TaxID=3371016 RepID=A0AA40I482_CNENI|nr:hypothetical protein QTO34_015481 [Eptesicus nilssonii]